MLDIVGWTGRCLILVDIGDWTGRCLILVVGLEDVEYWWLDWKMFNID